MPRPTEYTVGWITALPVEMAAAMTMLNEVHENPTIQNPQDHNNYIFGSIGPHYVVIACLPAGVYGTTSAAVIAVQMMASFPSIKFGLMVGIGGGVPSSERDIRLGDVVVGKPQGELGGVIQYDFGKVTQGGQFNMQGSLNKPPQVLLTAVSTMEAMHIMKGNQIHSILTETGRDELSKQT